MALVLLEGPEGCHCLPFLSRVHATLQATVGRSISLLAHPSIGPLVGRSLITKTIQIGTIRLFERWRQSVMTRQALDVVYTEFLLPLPNSTQLNLLCIWPC